MGVLEAAGSCRGGDEWVAYDVYRTSRGAGPLGRRLGVLGRDGEVLLWAEGATEDWKHRWCSFTGCSACPDQTFLDCLETLHSWRWLLLPKSYPLSWPPTAALHTGVLLNAVDEHFIDTPSVEPSGLSSPHCRALQDLSAAPPALLPVSAVPRLLPLRDVARCKQRPQSLAWRRDISYIYTSF